MHASPAQRDTLLPISPPNLHSSIHALTIVLSPDSGVLTSLVLMSSITDRLPYSTFDISI